MVLKLFTLIAVLVAVPTFAQDVPAGNQPQNAIPVRCVNTLGTTFESCGGTSAAGTDVNISGVNGAAPAANNPMPGRLTDGTSYYKATTPSDTQPVSAATLPLPTGASTGAKQDTQQTALDAIKAAVELIDNFISGARGLVTEDNSGAIKTAVETIDNFVSGSRGLVTEDNSAAIKARTDNIPPLGQALAAASVPVILPSATITTLTPPAAITGFATSAKQDTAQTRLDLLLADATFTGRINTQGQKTSALSTPVVLASDALPPPDRAATGTIIANSALVSLLSSGTGTVSVTVTGTWTGTIVWFGIDGSGVAQVLTGMNLSTGALETTTTANGTWLIPSGGWSSVGALSIAWTSGTASIGLIARPSTQLVALGRSLPTGSNLIGGILSNVAVGTTAPSKIDIIGGLTNDPTPLYQPLPLGAGGQAVQVVVLASPRPGLPKPPCNAVLRTNCSPKGF